MSTIADSYLTDYINPDTDNQRKWVYWAPVQRLDTIFAYINRNYWNAPENCWRVDMEGFRMGMAMEAAWMATIAGYALVKGIRLHENIGPIYRRILAASQGELSLDEVLFKDELSDCLYHCNLHTASELMDMKQSTKDFEKALKPPPKWWLSLAPGLSGATGLHPNYARALDIARCNPDFVQQSDDATREVLRMLEDIFVVLEALKTSESEQLDRINKILSEDEKGLVALYLAAYPNGRVGGDDM